MSRHSVEERLQRLLAITARLSDGVPVPVKELCDRYRVSEHQLRKDLEILQFIGVPPYTYYAPTVTFDGDEVSLFVDDLFKRQPTLTRPEAFAVLAAGNAALQLDPDLESLRSAMAKLADALELDNEVDVVLERPEHLDLVRRAVDEHHRLAVTYWSAWRDELTERRVDPRQVTFLEGAWYLLAFDHDSGEERKFRVDRIVECAETGETFEPEPFEPMTEVFEPPPFAVQATVRFPRSAWWVTEYVDVDVTEEDENSFAAVVTSVGESWLGRLLLRTGGEVIEPEDRRDLRRRAAERVLVRYRAE